MPIGGSYILKHYELTWTDVAVSTTDQAYDTTITAEEVTVTTK